jgi:MSHA biogenesis protein MshP
MSHEPVLNPRAIARSAGVGLVTAIFLLVVLAGLAVAMVTVFTSQRTTAAMDERGARAYQAARAGIEWGVFMHARGGGCPGLNYPAVKEASTSFTFPTNSSLAGFVVTVKCTQKAASSDPLMRMVIEAIACSPATVASGCSDGAKPNNPDYVHRKLEAEI